MLVCTGLAAQTGRIEGTVVLAPALEGQRMRFRPYAGAGSDAVPPPPRVDATGLMPVVIYLESVSVSTTGERRSFEVRQRDQVFVPRILPVLVGSTVAFPNDDPIFHNVFSLSSAKAFDLGRYPKGQTKSVVFDREGVVPVFCHIHSDMRAVVLVLANPVFTQPDAGGGFTLANVPAGTYTITAWHDRIQPIRKRVTVAAGATARVDFDLPVLDGAF
jgi:plastocyanin